MEPQRIEKLVHEEKYRWTKPDGTSDELTVEDSLKRCARGVYAKDAAGNGAHLAEATELMLERILNPAGRIHSGAGTDKRVTLINCYVGPELEDSLDSDEGVGIMDSLKVSALTQQMGGGIGNDFSPLRPAGAIVKRTGSVSSGVLPFMDMWHAMCSTIMSSGSRRGAMMGTLSDSHPDLPNFIVAKQKPGRLTNFNVSVLVSDPLMEAIKKDWDWDFGFQVPPAKETDILKVEQRDGKPWYVYKVVRAQELWDSIIRNTFDYAEPGVIYIDRINYWNNLYYCEDIRCTNPCGEQPLPPNSDCNLGAINLARLVKNPFTDKAEIDWDKLKQAVRVMVRFLDNVLDVTLFPTEEQAKEAVNKRRIGLGVTGLGNLLQFLKIRYGSDASLETVEEVMKTVCYETYRASIELAKERGSFPLFDKEKYLKGNFIKTLPKDIQDSIAQYGIRNGVLLTIAPTGTTSIYYGNTSSGLEPTFAWSYFRKVLKADNSFEEFAVEDYGFRVYKEVVDPNAKPAELPDYMVTALELSVKEHIEMQAICQKYVDSSISKTINCPEDMKFEDFKQVYMDAYDAGLKGCTTYRPSGVRGAVLSMESQMRPIVVKRPEVLYGSTYKVKWPALEAAYYITINDYEENGVKRPFEIFIVSKAVEHQEWIVALTRTISAVFRKGGDVTFLVEELEQVHSAAHGGMFIGQKYVPSQVAFIAGILRRHFEYLGLMAPAEKLKKIEDPSIDITKVKGDICPSCQAPAFVKKEGCFQCLACNFTKCG